MKQTEKLTNEDVHEILYAIGVSEGETGGDYSQLKNKLFALYPEVKADVDQANKEWEDRSKQQTNARKEIASKAYHSVKMGEKFIPQLQKFIKDNYDLVRSHYSDEICLSADLFKYHFPSLKRRGLLTELREELKTKGQQKGNEWMKDYHKTTTDEELWHELTKNLEVARR